VQCYKRLSISVPYVHDSALQADRSFDKYTVCTQCYAPPLLLLPLQLLVPLSQDAMQRAKDAEKPAKQQAAASTTTSKSKWAQQKYSGTLLLHITATTSCCCHTASTSVLIAATAIATAGVRVLLLSCYLSCYYYCHCCQ
jgi:hypothetical protein